MISATRDRSEAGPRLPWAAGWLTSTDLASQELPSVARKLQTSHLSQTSLTEQSPEPLPANGESQALLGTTAGVGWGAQGAVSIPPALLWTSSTPHLGSLPPSARQRNRRVFIAQSRKLRHREISLTGLRTLARAVSDGYVANWNAGVLQGLNPRSAM